MSPFAELAVERPERWDIPFGDAMTDDDVERLLCIPPFVEMNPARFPESQSLRGILRNDCRIMHYRPGDLIVREGDYGNSAFLLLEGNVRVALESLAPELLGRSPRKRGSWWRAIAALLWPTNIPERRLVVKTAAAAQPYGGVGQRTEGEVRIFLQDVPRILAATETSTLGPGEVFGELSALTRTPRSSSIFAETEVTLLEIRWQGLRDLMRRDDALRSHIQRLYREHSLEIHLRETPLLAHLPAEKLEEVAAAAEFVQYGGFEWHHDFARLANEDPSRRIAAEPVIAEEGSEPEGLLLLRSGFARLSRRHGNGHQTIAYLGKGQVFGWAEFAFQAEHHEPTPLLSSLRAIGYVDLIRIPAEVVRRLILPHVPQELRKQGVKEAEARLAQKAQAEQTPVGEATLKSVSLLEFLVERRYINGTMGMLIDLDRCTRCDDCVRACAATHDNNPRFVRQGPKHGQFMMANACLHCVDPVCMIGCPTGAIGRDEENGAVTINDLTCIGCGTCAQSCPYSAIRMVEIRDEVGNRIVDKQSELPVLKATKCDLCSESLGGPACQRACPHDALARINVSDAQTLSQWVTR